MGFLPVTHFPSDTQGRLVFTPRVPGKRSYIVPPDRAEAFQRFHRRYWILFFVALAITPIYSLWASVGVVLLWVAGFWLKLWHFTRGLEPATEVPPPLSHAQALDESVREMGGPTIVLIMVFGALMTALSVSWVVRFPRQVRNWIDAAFFTWMMTYAAMLGWRLRRLSHPE